MSVLFPHTPYAEDQPLPHLILGLHVLDRGFQSGALLGTVFGVARNLVLRRRGTNLSIFGTPLLRSAGLGGAISTALITLGLPVRMWGRERVEWEDRAWRLLENKGQLECDTYSTAGAVVGAAAAAWRQGMRHSGWRVLAGGAGVGSLAGVAAYMGWRYGVKGGKWEEAVAKVVEEVDPSTPMAIRKK